MQKATKKWVEKKKPWENSKNEIRATVEGSEVINDRVAESKSKRIALWCTFWWQ